MLEIQYYIQQKKDYMHMILLKENKNGELMKLIIVLQYGEIYT